MNVILWVGIGISVLMIIYLIYSLNYSHRKRNNLTNYMVYLLLNDEIRNDHSIKFVNWIKELSEDDSKNIGIMASQTLEQMADGLAEPTQGRTSSYVAATFMMLEIWKEAQQNKP